MIIHLGEGISAWKRGPSVCSARSKRSRRTWAWWCAAILGEQWPADAAIESLARDHVGGNCSASKSMAD